MPDRRQAFKKEPIEVDLGDDRVISVGPLPWEQRNEVGNAIVQQHTEELNESFKLLEGDALQIETKFSNKLKDPFTVLHLALPEAEYNKIVDKKVFTNQMTELLVAILEVNEMMHLRPLVDPNFSTPDSLGGLSTLLSPTEVETPKTESGHDSSSGESNGSTSEVSPTPSLVES